MGVISQRMSDYILGNSGRMIDDQGNRLRRDALAECFKEFRELYKADIEAEAARLAVDRMNGPHTHRYRGVGVTEEQFWALLKAEGFELPEPVR